MKRYLEQRQRGSGATMAVLADMVRFIHARQYLGSALVICDDPDATAHLAQRQWLKLSRLLQQRRAATGSAEEILRFTATITHMQHMQFVAGLPQDDRVSYVYFVTASQLNWLPPRGLTLYLLTSLPEDRLDSIVAQLSNQSLMVDYTGQISIGQFGLVPKVELETTVAQSWLQVDQFLRRHNVNVEQLVPWSSEANEAFNDSLDILLGVSIDFLQVASQFQRHLDLAQPLKSIPKVTRQHYEVFARLAHRVQVLTPGVFTDQFLKAFADDNFFLHDRHDGAAWAELVAWHQAAGRNRLAAALQVYAATPVQAEAGVLHSIGL